MPAVETLAKSNRRIIDRILQKFQGAFVLEIGAGANTLVVDSNSRVGIGTAAPGTLLHLYKATGSIICTIETGDASTPLLRVENSNRQWQLGLTTAGNFIIDDKAGATRPFTILQAALSNTLYLSTSGRVGINGLPATSCALEIDGTTGAVLLPRLTTGQRDALTPINGMIIYSTTNNAIEAYENGSWVNL